MWKTGGEISNGISTAQRCETPLHCAHVAPETTRDVVGLGDPVERCLARTGRGSGRWNGGQLEMTQDTRDHRFPGQGGNDAECTAPTKGTGGHIQVKHAPQQSCPAPVRCPRVGLMPIHTLLARCRRDRAAQTAVWRQTASIPHEMDARQRYQRRQLLQEFQRREGKAGCPVRPRFCERVHEAPWAASSRRSSATAPRAVYRIKRSN